MMLAQPVSKYLDPKNDMLFKKIFGQHENILKAFLNAVLKIPAPIEELAYINPQQVPQSPFLKSNTVDVKCRDTQGRHFIVEMQMFRNNAFIDRMIFGMTHAYVLQFESGDAYHKANAIYALALLNQNDHHLPQDTYYHYYKLTHQTHPHALQHLNLIFVELQKFKACSEEEHVLWLSFLKDIEAFVAHYQTITPEIDQALQMAEKAKFSPDEFLVYTDAIAKARVDAAYYGTGWEEGWADGREEGREEGALQAKLETARQLRSMNFSDEDICKATRLSLKDLESL